MRGRLIVLPAAADHADHDDLFASVLAKRGKKLAGHEGGGGGGSHAARGDAAKAVKHFTFKKGLKNLKRDLLEKGTLATKVSDYNVRPDLRSQLAF
jgi:hypothetical protein